MPEKTVYPSTKLEFLGITLDTDNMKSCLSPEKIQDYLDCILNLKSKERSTVKEFQKAIGKLQWACTVVLLGRPFLRRLIFAISGRVNPHHRNSICSGIKDDLDVWITFLIRYCSHCSIQLCIPGH